MVQDQSSENKVSGKTLLDTRECYEEIIDLIPDTIYRLDPNGNFIYVSIGVKSLGFQPEDLIGKHFSKIVHPDFLEEAQYRFNERRVGDRATRNLELRIISPNAKSIEDESHVYPTILLHAVGLYSKPDSPDSGENIIFYGTQGVVRDITDRKKDEEKIRTLSYAVEQSMSSVLITDVEGKIEYINPKFTESTGYSMEEVAGKTPAILKSDKHPPKFYENLWDTILAGKEWRNVFCNKKKNGNLFWELQSISPIYNYKGEISKFISIRIDDTERRKAEEKLKIYSKELERSNKELQDFASIASHDLQEPLRKVIAFGDRLEESSGHNEKEKDYLKRMRLAALRMKLLLENLLEYSRVTTRARPFEKIALKDLLDDVIDDLEIKIKAKHASITIEPLPYLDVDPAQMRQLFQNLIVNALKYCDGETRPDIKITGSVTDKKCEIAIEDNGIGFDEKHTERIFEPFQRLHGKAEYEGTGMGLAICKKIVDRHNGEITAKSTPGQGSKFIVTLPEKQEF